MTNALGNLASLSPGQSVRSLSNKACERYMNATGSNDDVAARRAAAAALRAIAVRASSQFSDGGPGDIWCRRVLPIAFLGKQDKDKTIASLWKEVWEEGGNAANLSGDESFGVLVGEKLLPELVKAAEGALKDVSWARRVAGATALQELCDSNILAPIGRKLDFKNSSCTSKEMQRAKQRAQASSRALKALVDLISMPRIWSGKTDIARTAVHIASKWTQCGESERERKILYGWTEAHRPCPWAPISSAQFGSTSLFVGDDFFDSSKTVDLLQGMDMNDSKKMDVSEEQCDKKLDFTEADNVTDTEDMPMSEPVESNVCSSVSLMGLSRLLLQQGLPSSQTQKASLISSMDEVLPYKAASLSGLASLLKSLNQNNHSTPIILENIYAMMAPSLLAVVDVDNVVMAGEDDVDNTRPPLITARVLEVFASVIWPGMGKDKNRTENSFLLAKVFVSSGGPKQAAWTVRESAALAVSQLAKHCCFSFLRQHDMVSTLIESITNSLKDKKFWRVRLAGLSVLQSLVSRVGSKEAYNVVSKSSSQEAEERQLILESLLPFKENFLSLASIGLRDSETKVTALSTEICGALTWWP